jgi:hypothetical protein
VAVRGFESNFRRHLVVEQRRAVLEALAKKLGPDVTMGDVLDAADGLGWAEPMGDLTLADLAEALLRPQPGGRPVAVEPEVEEPEVEEPEVEEPEVEEPPRATESKGKGKGKAKVKVKAKPKTPAAAEPEAKSKTNTRGKTKAKAKTNAKAKAEPEPKAKSKSKQPASTSTTKATAKPGGGMRLKTARLRALRAKVDAEDRMSLEEAAELLVPIVEELGQATMQDLEDFTGIGRRKLRFHIGQLVRHDQLERHGMGRGTYYTASE